MKRMIMRIGMTVLMLCLLLMGIPVTADDSAPEKDGSAVQPEPMPCSLLLDNAHVYDYMPQSYAEGYEPQTVGDYAVLVLPLSCDADEAPESVRASVSLGDPSSSPFVIKNYEQTVPLAMHTASDGNAYPRYLVQFWLAMYTDRMNGCYPVEVQVSGGDAAASFTLYVNIRDGLWPQTDEPEQQLPEKEEPVILCPKALVKSCTAPDGAAAAGETVPVRFTLQNTSRSEALKNVTVTASVQSESLVLQDASDTLFFEEIGAGAEFEAAFRYAVKPDAPAGQYEITLQLDYAYAKGMTGSGTLRGALAVSQPLRIEFSPVAVPSEAVVSDRLELNVQAMNLSRSPAANVRAVLECDGLLPDGAAFLGEVAGGAEQTGILTARVTSRSGSEPYGQTDGSITFYYTDEAGQEHSEVQAFSLNIKSPFSERKTEPQQVRPTNWYGIMAAIGGGILLLCGYFVLRHRKRGQS